MSDSGTSDVCHAILVRHGATAANLAKPAILQGRGVNLGLSPTGQKQAERAASFLKDFPVRAIYSSPLLRAQETAQFIASPHKQDLRLVTELTEVDVGIWEGRSWEDIAKEDPDAYRRFQADPGSYGYQGGESMQMVQDRAVPVLRAILDQHLGETIVIVAHNVVNRAFLAAMLGMPLAVSRRLMQDNGCLNFLEHRPGETLVRTVNLVHHLHD